MRLKAYPLPEFEGDENVDGKGELDVSDFDNLLPDAARLIVTHQQGSTSLIQRKMKLGYNRAGRIMDQLEATGIVGPFTGSKPREVLFMDLDQLNTHLRSIGIE
jgi:S-DNA-T family DNA segregation ATPase FtsK/SpoIIIE